MVQKHLNLLGIRNFHSVFKQGFLAQVQNLLQIKRFFLNETNILLLNFQKKYFFTLLLEENMYICTRFCEWCSTIHYYI